MFLDVDGIVLEFDGMTRAYSYIRFSSAKQMKGNSQRRQTAFARGNLQAQGLEPR